MPNLFPQPHIAPVSPAHLRVLVADDDPGSCRFLCDGLRSLGAQAEACMDGVAALACARAEAFDLLLLDCRMPGGGALEILAALRGDTQAHSAECMAVATTAQLEPRQRQPLLAAGFSDILIKPCSVADLQRMLVMVQPDRHDASVLDDHAALITAGDASTMHALRQLLREELAQLDQELDSLSNDPVGFSERLHRLRSSCGFCGAAALSAQAAQLQRQLEQQRTTPATLARFRQTLLATREALDR